MKTTGRRQFIGATARVIAGGAAVAIIGSGCIAPAVSPTVATETTQAWRCSHCGHLTRSAQDLSNARCPRCGHKGDFERITEEQLKEYLKSAG